ncbi:MAG: hypothetical protein ACLFUV_00575 [Methanomassiliicoccales archaeon]
MGRMIEGAGEMSVTVVEGGMRRTSSPPQVIRGNPRVRALDLIDSAVEGKVLPLSRGRLIYSDVPLRPGAPRQGG